MKARLLSALLLVLTASSALAQTIPAPAPNAPVSTLQMEVSERQFFELGTTLARGAFAYAELAKQATGVAKTRSKIAQVGQLGKLEPAARRDRLAAREGLTEAAGLMRALGASSVALAAVTRAADALAGPLPMTPEAKTLAVFNGAAARTLSSLHEFETLSSLPEDPALRKWLASPVVNESAQVWYGEGEISGLAQIAAAYQMPELLPPAQQIATDLRGLRDWLSLRLPDAPSQEQIALKDALEAFLAETAQTERPGIRSRKSLTLAELQTLGGISHQLQTEVLGPSPATAPPQTSEART